MEYSPEIELILKGLKRDRDELSAKLAEIDKVIKKVKTGNLDFNKNGSTNGNGTEHIKQNTTVFPHNANLRVQILTVMDMLGKACKLKEINAEINNHNGSNINIRETVRTLNKSELLKMMREKNSERGIYWVKSEWLEDNNTRLKDEYKFDGFDMLYKAENLEYV